MYCIHDSIRPPRSTATASDRDEARTKRYAPIDKELEKRGHAFARYADDCNVYVRSKRAGERVMEGLRRLFAGLRLRVNEAKSAVARPQDRKFLGYSFRWRGKRRRSKARFAAQSGQFPSA